jgi:hypothetical protein
MLGLPRLKGKPHEHNTETPTKSFQVPNVENKLRQNKHDVGPKTQFRALP